MAVDSKLRSDSHYFGAHDPQTQPTGVPAAMSSGSETGDMSNIGAGDNSGVPEMKQPVAHASGTMNVGQMRLLNSPSRHHNRILLSTNTPFSDTVMRSLLRDPDIELRLIADKDFNDGADGVDNLLYYPDIPQSETYRSRREWMNITAASLADWADVLIVAPVDAGTLGSMVSGLTTSLTLTILRGWDISKTILLVPKMMLLEWKSPITGRQLDQLRTFWPWVKILPPVLSRFEPPDSLVEVPWEGREMFYEEVRKGLGWPFNVNGAEDKIDSLDEAVIAGRMDKHLVKNDMDTATVLENRSESTVRRSSTPSRDPNAPVLPPELLTMIFEALGDWENIDSSWEWWRNCPDLPTNDYLPDALDGASRAGFIHVLEWWRKSGLPLRYTERALESASAEGQIAVLDWWKRVSESSAYSDPVPLKIGKSVLLAAQSGKTASLAWWDRSGIPYSHGESVARIASTHGHVPVLELWYRRKGSKIIFDNQVLVGATKNGHVDVLEWWRRSGLRVEFKTCDIEEALEDAVSGAEDRVRRWWERNGLNLGVGTSEWMKVKVL
ncbi:hypothetical protein CIRG_01251 [Coccidioides immitis RMSCC 2394]|uniref:Flavoprotein domain-containing protein n=1 Tax=Coccidioides immitis RMSCC 2394 TaxID=404692 RepID=A0A0J6XY00_COCIT|nr:hypothetical protein CIRG_01251 [Coccidioides immitis RMSCC 2394]